MTAQYVESFSPDTYKNQILFHKLRSNLLGLMKFEQVYVLARWIRSLFADILEAPIESSALKVKPSTQATPPDQANQLDSLRTKSAEKTVYDSRPNGGSQEVVPLPTPAPYDLSSMSSTTQLVGETLGGGPELLSNFGTIPSTPAGTMQFVHPARGLRDVFMPSASLSSMQWPSPSSFQFQNFNFLADLGLAGFDESVWNASHQYVDR